MTLVRIVKSWHSPDIFQQSPDGKGIWGDIKFTEQPVPRCDYLIAFNHIPQEITVEVPPENIWCFVQEPPVPICRWMRKGFDTFARVYAQDPELVGPRYIKSHGALPWHVGRSYDQLKNWKWPKKERNLSWITSNSRNKPGHSLRLKFLRDLQEEVQFDLFGRGFTPIDDKWTGIEPYRYGIAFENHSCDDYVTEKIFDCFLAGAMPLYYGATNIGKYFPEDSYLWIDPRDPATPKRIKEVLKSDLAERSRDAILEARRRVLEEHQFFPRAAKLIAESAASGKQLAHRKVTLAANHDLTGFYMENGPVKRLWTRVVKRATRMFAQRQSA